LSRHQAHPYLPNRLHVQTTFEQPDSRQDTNITLTIDVRSPFLLREKSSPICERRIDDAPAFLESLATTPAITVYAHPFPSDEGIWHVSINVDDGPSRIEGETNNTAVHHIMGIWESL